MELVPVVAEAGAGAFFSVVCVRRMTLGEDMDRSLEALKSRSRSSFPVQSERVAPIRRTSWIPTGTQSQEPIENTVPADPAASVRRAS
jgi:hypothetical protein